MINCLIEHDHRELRQNCKVREQVFPVCPVLMAKIANERARIVRVMAKIYLQLLKYNFRFSHYTQKSFYNCELVHRWTKTSNKIETDNAQYF